MRKFFYFFHCLITLVIFGCGVIATAILLPNVAGIKSFIVLSGSMEPSIPTGAVVYINTHVEAQDIEIGDVIAFDMSGNRIVHRVTAIDTQYKNFTTKGDANENEDLALVSFDDLLGRMCGHIPYLGYFIAYVGTKNGFVMALALLVLWTTSGSLSKKSETKKEE